MKNTNCPLVKTQRRSKRADQTGSLRVALLLSFVVTAFSAGAAVSQGVAKRNHDSDRLQAQIQELKLETQAVRTAKAVVKTNFVADL